MTGIGIPVAFAFWALPALAFILGSARILQRAVLDRLAPRGLGTVNVSLAIALVLGGLAGVAMIDRRNQAEAIEALVAGDLDALVLPLQPGGIAIRSSDQANICNDLCRRLLLTGAATTVFLQEVDGPAPPDPDSAATAYWLEARAVCPDPALGRGNDPALDIQTKDAVPGAARPPASIVALRARIAQGTCLIDAPATLGQADLVITKMRLSNAPSGDKQGFQKGTALITADRMSLHQREGAAFRETYRWTGGKASRLWPLAVPAPTFGRDLDMGIGFGRSEVTFNTHPQYYYDPDWTGFLTETLGLELSLQSADADSTRAAVVAILDRTGQISDSDQTLIAGYLGEVGTGKALGSQGGLVSYLADDRDLYLRILQDFRVRLRYEAVHALPPTDQLTEAELATLAKAAFDRLLTADQARQGEAGTAGDILALLPADTLAPYRENLFRLTEDRQNRWRSLELLIRLADFGDAGAERLAFLIGDAAHEYSDQSGNGWQHPYLAGLIGLCRMGSAAALQREAIDALIDAHILEISESSYGRLTLNMLVALGYTQDELTQIRAGSEHPMSEEQLQYEFEHASHKPDCWY